MPSQKNLLHPKCALMEAVPFRLGARQREVAWTLVLDTADGANSLQEGAFPNMGEYPLQSRSVAVLQPHYVPFA
jgi:hypothetical protein